MEGMALQQGVKTRQAGPFLAHFHTLMEHGARFYGFLPAARQKAQHYAAGWCQNMRNGGETVWMSQRGEEVWCSTAAVTEELTPNTTSRNDFNFLMFRPYFNLKKKLFFV